MKKLLFTSQLPHLGCWRYEKFQKLKEIFKAGFDNILINIQAEGRKSVSNEKSMFNYQLHMQKLTIDTSDPAIEAGSES